MDKMIDLINQGGTGEYDDRQERGEAVAYLCNGTRFKVAATSSTTPVVGISGLPAELAGRWVALVAADDDCHLAPAMDARAWMLRKDGRMWTTHIKRSMENYAQLGAEVTPLYAHPSPSPAPAGKDGEAVSKEPSAEFREWWLTNVPAGTVIGSPEWWLPRIWSRAAHPAPDAGRVAERAVANALDAAVSALYLNDSSDFGSALWEVVT
ncbi:MAG: hypothetical protein ABFE08_04440, partial [Armatimonadia bacterium]